MPRKAIIASVDGHRTVIEAGEGLEWELLVAEKEFAKRPALECRGCGAALTRVAGQLRPNHFRHLHRPDPGDCRYAGESDEHIRLKSLLVEIVNNIDGWVADDEVHSVDHRWVADVLAEQPATGRGIAFEVQLASQAVHGDLGAANRTERRTADSYECVWFTKEAGVGHAKTAELLTLKDRSDGVKLHRYVDGEWVAEAVPLETFVAELLAGSIDWTHEHSPVQTADTLVEADDLATRASRLLEFAEQQRRRRRPLFAAAVQDVKGRYELKAELLFRDPDGSLSDDPSFEIAETALGGGVGIWVRGTWPVDRVDGHRLLVESSRLVVVVGPLEPVEHDDNPRVVGFGSRVHSPTLPALYTIPSVEAPPLPDPLVDYVNAITTAGHTARITCSGGGLTTLKRYVSPNRPGVFDRSIDKPYTLFQVEDLTNPIKTARLFDQNGDPIRLPTG